MSPSKIWLLISTCDVLIKYEESQLGSIFLVGKNKNIMSKTYVNFLFKNTFLIIPITTSIYLAHFFS